MAFVAKDFWSILIIWSLLGVTTTFESGASSSWVVDNLKKKKKPNLQQEYFIKLQSIFLLGAIIAPLIGSVIIRYFSYTGLWLVFGCGMILTGILLSNIPEYYKPKKVSVKKTILNNFKLAKKGFAFVKKTKEIYYFIIAGFFNKSKSFFC